MKIQFIIEINDDIENIDLKVEVMKDLVFETISEIFEPDIYKKEMHCDSNQ